MKSQRSRRVPHAEAMPPSDHQVKSMLSPMEPSDEATSSGDTTDSALCATPASGDPVEATPLLPPAVVALLMQLGIAANPAQSRPAPYLVGVDEVAATLGVSKWSVYRWAEAGRIPCIRVGRKMRFVLGEVLAALRSHSQAITQSQKRPPPGVAPEPVAELGRARTSTRPARATRAEEQPSMQMSHQLRSIRSATRALTG